MPEPCAVVGTPAAASYVLTLLTELGVPHSRYDELGAVPWDACGSVLVLASEYPVPRVVAAADADPLLVYLRSGGRAYLEFATGPAELVPAVAGPVRIAGTDRIYVADGNTWLEPLAILDEHSSSMLPVTPPDGAVELLTYGRVAGTHTAVFGPADESWPALLDVGIGAGRLLYASTALSNAERGRYRPAARWRRLLRELLTAVHPGEAQPAPAELTTVPRVWAASGQPVRLRATAGGAVAGPVPLELTEVSPGVHESEPVALADGVHTFTLGRSTATIEVGPRERRYRRMVDRGIDWFHRAGMFFGEPDGSAGVAEGFSSEIGPDGVSPFGPVRRGDGHVQVSHAFRMYADLTGDKAHRTIADNVMDLVTDRMQLTDRNALYGAFEPRDARTDLTGTNNLFADDNGWIAMFALLSGAAESGLRGVESLIRSANTELGLQSDPWRTPTTLLTRGWAGAAVAPLNEGLDVSSHWQSSALCAYLTAYGLTGERRYLEIAERGLDHMAGQFPRTRLETSRTCEAVRFVLPLVGGYRYTRKPLYLDTLRAIAAYLKTKQDPESGGLLEWDGRNPRSNAAFGVDEASIFQSNGDPVTDQLYCTGFAAMSLPLAARETGDPLYDELATGVLDFLSRIQFDLGDERLDGTWMRAFDVRGWEYFGSNADIGWGPYCVETGWSHAPSLIGAMLWLTGADLFPATPGGPTTLPARVAAEFDSIAAGTPEPARFFRRPDDGRVVREQGGATAVLGDLRAAGEPVWVDNPPAGSVEIYVRGEDDRLHHSYLHERLGQGVWRQVGELGIAGDPGVVFNPAADAVEVYVRGADGRIHHTTLVDPRAGHGPWDPVGHLSFDTDPVVAFDTERNKVLVRAKNRETVKENRWHPPWQDPYAPVTRWETA
jgi:hypothetical protein